MTTSIFIVLPLYIFSQSNQINKMCNIFSILNTCVFVNTPSIYKNRNLLASVLSLSAMAQRCYGRYLDILYQNVFCFGVSEFADFLVHFVFQHMSVDVECNAYTGVSKQGLHYFQLHLLFKASCCECMPQ